MQLIEPFNKDVHRIMTRGQVRRFDRQAVEQLGISGLVLMENAGRGCAELAMQMLDRRRGQSVVVFCGAGNNGGDGFVIARHLYNCGVDVRVVLCAGRDKIRGDATANLRILEKIGTGAVGMDLDTEKIPSQVKSFCAGCGLIVDAIFGTGLTGQVSDQYAQLIDCINASAAPVLSVDIPSGMDCDTGAAIPACIRAAATVTFAAAKKGFFEDLKAGDFVGRLYVASIGVNPGRGA